MLTDKRKILYLEDDEFTRLMVQSQFENAGFSVDAFGSYSDLMTAMSENMYDVIVTDLNIDGHEPHQMVKNIKASYNNIPVAVLSGANEDVPDANLVITKPLDDEKIKKVAALLNGKADEVNLSKVYKFACGDKELLVNYVNIFISNYEKDLMLLKTEVDNRDLKAIKNLAHKMLSSVSYYDQKELNKLLQQLELYVEDMDRLQINKHFRSIESQSNKLLNSVRRQVIA